MNPSIKTIAKYMPWLSPDQVKLVRRLMTGEVEPTAVSKKCDKWVRLCYHEPSEIEQIMAAIDDVIETCGVEAISDKRFSCYKPMAVYCNNGDTYAPTVIYCYKTDRFLIMSWGDYYEKNCYKSEEAI